VKPREGISLGSTSICILGIFIGSVILPLWFG
jgi:hypothetical protein